MAGPTNAVTFPVDPKTYGHSRRPTNTHPLESSLVPFPGESQFDLPGGSQPHHEAQRANDTPVQGMVAGNHNNLRGENGMIVGRKGSKTHRVQIVAGGTGTYDTRMSSVVIAESSQNATSGCVNNDNKNKTVNDESAWTAARVLPPDKKERLSVGTRVQIVAGNYTGKQGVIVGWKGAKTYRVQISGVAGNFDKRMSSVVPSRSGNYQQKYDDNSSTDMCDERRLTALFPYEERLPIGTCVQIVAGKDKGKKAVIVGWKGAKTYRVQISGVAGTYDKRTGSVVQSIEK